MIVSGGVDVGVRGGAAAIGVDDNGVVRLLDAIDIPTTGVKAKERVDAIALRSWLAKYQPQHVYVERAQALPRQGSSSGFKYGRAVGAIEAIIVCCEIPLTIIEPSAWKNFHHLYGKDEEGSRQRALQLFPAAHELFARKKDHGRAEAALIALYGASLRPVGGQLPSKVAAKATPCPDPIPKIAQQGPNHA
jgi:crossover junction endodeoxyribonuclease RuvC